MTRRFDPTNMDRLLAPTRREYNDPDQVLAPLNLAQCMVLADIGCGPGWFAIEAGRKLPPGGIVFAVDIEQIMLDKLAERVKVAGLDNIHPVLAVAADEFPVDSATCDAVLLANVYHECDPYSNLVHEICRILKPGGTLLLVDWKPEPTPVGPPLEVRLDLRDVTEELTAAGFLFAGACPAGPYHYGLIFRRPGEE